MYVYIYIIYHILKYTFMYIYIYTKLFVDRATEIATGDLGKRWTMEVAIQPSCQVAIQPSCKANPNMAIQPSRQECSRTPDLKHQEAWKSSHQICRDNWLHQWRSMAIQPSICSASAFFFPFLATQSSSSSKTIKPLRIKCMLSLYFCTMLSAAFLGDWPLTHACAILTMWPMKLSLP